MIMTNRNDVKKMVVWDNMDLTYKKESYVLFHDNFKSVITVRRDDEESFLNGRSFNIYCYDNCKKIKEPTYKAFKNGEMPECYKDYWYRTKDNESIMHRATAYDLEEGTSKQLLLVDVWESNKDMFEDWEVQIEDKWQPVGVKE